VIVATMERPPEFKTSTPPVLTVVTLAVPPLSTTSVLPLVTTTPELTTPEETN
jgi:hypothetical protein